MDQLDETQNSVKPMVHALKRIEERLGSVESKLDRVVTAFPNSDFEGHKRYHETIVEMLAERRRLRMAIQEKTISGLIWMVLVGLGLAIWHEILRLLGR